MADNKGAAIVLDMDKDDLHWIVDEPFRRQGHLHHALKKTIFPFLKREGRLAQQAYADSNESAAYLLRMGFKPAKPYTPQLYIYGLPLPTFEMTL